MAAERFRPYEKGLAKIYNSKRWWLGLTFGDILDRVADLYPDKTGIVTEEVRLSWAELRNEVNRVAIAFQKLGLGKGDRVILQLPNWCEFLLAFFGLQKIGAIGVFALPRHSNAEIEYLAELTQAKGWVVPIQYRKTDYTPLIKALQAKKFNLEYIITPRGVIDGTILFEQMKDAVSLPPDPQGYLETLRPDPRDVANILLTGGTTGMPKGVPRDHNSHISNAQGWIWRWELSSHDTALIALPLGHNAAHVNALYSMTLVGGKIVVITGTSPKDILEAVEKERVTYITPVPAQMEAILNFPEFSKYDLSSVRLISLGGSHASAELIQRVYERFGQIQVANTFGMAEGPCTATRKYDSRELISTTVGPPTCPYDHFKIVDEREEEVPLGVEGELVCKGPGLHGLLQVHAKKGLSETFTGDGYLKSGDLARQVNKQGYIQITGRKKDVIIRGGENISSIQVEEWIAHHPRVESVAVVGMPDPILGERICAYIKPKKKDPPNFDELIAFLKEKGASVFLLPERIEIIDELPLTNVGKVDKKVLRADISGKLKAERKI